MSEEIKVHVCDFGRKSLYMRYVDPLTGKQVTRSTGCGKKKDAVKAAAVWEAELREGRYKSPSKVTWEEFRDRYETEGIAGLAEKTAQKVASAFNSLEDILDPKLLSSVDAERIVQWQNELRKRGRAESTIKGNTAHLKAGLRWAKDMGLLHEVPKIRMPKRAKGGKVMKGRPINATEFKRMREAVHEVTGDDRAASWQHLIDGLWWTGLRLSEAMALKWGTSGLHVDLTGRHPMLRIPADEEKGNQDRLLPIAPEAAEFLLSTPEHERRGFVFNPANTPGRGRPNSDQCSRTITEIGRKADVVVDQSTRVGEPHTKYASAHDLRRAFGLRWAQRVMPAVLQQLMRHETIETTMRYYVGRDAEATTDLLYEATGNTLSNTPLSGTATDSP